MMIDLNEEPPASEMQLDEPDAATAAVADAQGSDEAVPRPGDPASVAAHAEHGNAPAAASDELQAEAAQMDANAANAGAILEQPVQATPDGADADAPDLGVDGDDEVGLCGPYGL